MLISTDNLGKKFNREWIFKGLDYVFEENGYYAITGPNGSGKSTLIQVLAGSVPQSEGRLNYTYKGKEIEIEEVYNFLSISAPYLELIEEFTLWEFLNFHFKFKAIRDGLTLEKALSLMYLENAKHKPIKYFSSGMKQRLKLGIAFYANSSLLFLDEPTSNMDEKGISWYQENLKQLINKSLIIIASNQEHEYLHCNNKIDLLNYKKKD